MFNVNMMRVLFSPLVRNFSSSRVLRNSEVERFIGSREVVGFGFNGQPVYIDNYMFPYPAIRFREVNPALKAIREKERGDWKSLSLSEKKCLYRVTFCQSISEVIAPTGEFKSVIGLALIFVNIAVLFYLFVFILVRHEIPDTFDDDRQAAMLRRIIDLRMNPITGLSSKWDYDEDDWKANVKPKKNA